MDRREFLGAAAAVTTSAGYGSVAPLPRRPYKNGIDLSIIAFGGIVVCGLSQEEASRRVAEAYGLHQSGRPLTAASMRFLPQSGTQFTRLISSSARSRNFAWSISMNHWSIARKMIGVLLRQQWG